jgi:hypothetical protein
MIAGSDNRLFIIENDKVVINPKALIIPEFATIHERDRSTGKKRSVREFAYIYYIADYKSEYDVYGLSKESQLGLDLFNNKNYKPDPEIQKAIEKYKLLQETPSMRYLISMRKRINRTITYLDNVEIRDKIKGEEGEVKYLNPHVTIDKIVTTMKQIEDVIEKLEKWEKKVFDEEEDMKIRGGGMLNVFEDPESAKWINNK